MSKTKKIALTGLLTAIEIVLQLIGNFVVVGTANINISLITIAVAAITCGPLSGMFVGLINGVFALIAPSTTSFFIPINLGGTILICLLKTTLAGLAAAYIYKAFKKHTLIGAIVASLSVPVINTFIFAGGSLIFYMDKLKEMTTTSNPNYWSVLLFSWIGINFIIEILISVLLCPPICKAIDYYNIKRSK